jgi:hypothetical protein
MRCACYREKVLEAAREFGGFSRVWDTLGTFFYVSFVPGAHRLFPIFPERLAKQWNLTWWNPVLFLKFFREMPNSRHFAECPRDTPQKMTVL